MYCSIHGGLTLVGDVTSSWWSFVLLTNCSSKTDVLGAPLVRLLCRSPHNLPENCEVLIIHSTLTTSTRCKLPLVFCFKFIFPSRSLSKGGEVKHFQQRLQPRLTAHSKDAIVVFPHLFLTSVITSTATAHVTSSQHQCLIPA